MKSVSNFLIIGIFLINIFVLVTFVFAAIEVLEPTYYSTSMGNPQSYVDTIVGKGKLIVEEGAKITLADSAQTAIVTTLNDDGKGTSGGTEKLIVDLKALPEGSKILKDGSILINPGKPNEVKIFGGIIFKNKDGSIDIQKSQIEINGKVYSKNMDSIEPLSLRFSNDKITLSSNEEIAGQYGVESGAALFNFAGSISIYPDGHFDIEKGTYFSAYRNHGSTDIETWHLGKEITDGNDVKTYTGVAEKISYSTDKDWKPSDNQAFIKLYNTGGVETLDIGNVNFELNIGFYKQFFNDAINTKTNIIYKEVGNGRVTLNIEEGSGKFFMDNRGVNIMGNVAGINLNSEYMDINGEIHNFILNEDGSIMKCSEPCRLCGITFYDRESQMKSRFGQYYEQVIPKSYVQVTRYKTSDNQEMLRYYDIENSKYVSILYDVDTNSFLKENSNGNFVQVRVASDGIYEGKLKPGPISSKLIESEFDSRRTGDVPEGVVKISPTVNPEINNELMNTNPESKYNQYIQEIKAGNILLNNKNARSGIYSQLYRYDMESGNFESVVGAGYGPKTITPEKLDEYKNSDTFQVAVYPYSYESGGSKSNPLTTITDSQGKIVGAIRSDFFKGEDVLVISNKGYFRDSSDASVGTDIKIIGVYKYGSLDTVKAFESRPFYQWYSRP